METGQRNQIYTIRNYLSSRSFKEISDGGDDTGKRIIGILNLTNGDTINCAEYAGYVVNIGEGEIGIVNVSLENLQPGAVLHLYAAGGSLCNISAEVGSQIITSVSSETIIDLLSFNSPASTLIIVSATKAALLVY